MHPLTQLPAYNQALHCFTDQISQTGFPFPGKLSVVLDRDVFPTNGLRPFSIVPLVKEAHCCAYQVGEIMLEYKRCGEGLYSMTARDPYDGKQASVVFSATQLIMCSHDLGSVSRKSVDLGHLERIHALDEDLNSECDDEESSKECDCEPNSRDQQVFLQISEIIASLKSTKAENHPLLKGQIRDLITQCKPNIAAKLREKLLRTIALLEIHPMFHRFMSLGQRWTEAVADFNKKCRYSFQNNTKFGSLLDMLKEQQDLSQYTCSFMADGEDLLYTFEMVGHIMMFIYHHDTLQFKAYKFEGDTAIVTKTLLLH